MNAFPLDVMVELRGAREVRIETSAGEGRPVHRAIIWVVVDDAGRVLVRSWRGERGRWYRELRANPVGALHVRNRRIPFHAELAADGERVEACSRQLRAKYAGSGSSLTEMLADEVLACTLEFHAASG